MTNTNSIRINDSKRAIEITKTFSKLASIYGSDEYNALKGAKTDNPTYRVIVKTAPKRKIEDRITMKDIITYVEAKSGAESEQMKTLLDLRGKSVNETKSILDVEETATFAEIKKWFFNTYSEIKNKSENRQNRIDEILAEAAKKATERAEAASNAVSA